MRIVFTFILMVLVALPSFAHDKCSSDLIHLNFLSLRQVQFPAAEDESPEAILETFRFKKIKVHELIESTRHDRALMRKELEITVDKYIGEKGMMPGGTHEAEIHTLDDLISNFHQTIYLYKGPEFSELFHAIQNLRQTRISSEYVMEHTVIKKSTSIAYKVSYTLASPAVVDLALLEFLFDELKRGEFI